MYRYETHCHTLYASACSSLDAETMVALYLANGYDGIVVTDHFFNGNTAISPSLGWKERVTRCRQIRYPIRQINVKINGINAVVFAPINSISLQRANPMNPNTI